MHLSGFVVPQQLPSRTTNGEIQTLSIDDDKSTK